MITKGRLPVYNAPVLIALCILTAAVCLAGCLLGDDIETLEAKAVAGAAPNSKPQTCTVSFNANNGNGTAPDPQTVNAGSSITLPDGSGMTRDGYTFGGWNTNSSGMGTNYNADASYTVTGTITLYARWIITYTASANGGASESTTQITLTFSAEPTGLVIGDISFGGNVSRGSATLSGTGTTRTISGFTVNYSGGSTVSISRNGIESGTKTIQVYQSCTVTFNINGGSGTPPPTRTVSSGSNITLPSGSGFSKSGYLLCGWNTDASGMGSNYSAGSIYTVPGTITLYAWWIEGVVSATGVELVRVPGGSFQMGDTIGDGKDDDRPVHTVTLSAFSIGMTEVTQSQWYAVMGTTIQQLQTAANDGSTNRGRGDTYPVYYVNWYHALVFCNKLSVMEGLTPAYRISNSTNPDDWGTVPTAWDAPIRATWDAVTIVSGSTGYRLPTEAQWEYAAKGGNGSPGNYMYAGSNTVGDVAWYSGNSGYISHRVGTKTPNGLGIYDMSGNVQEWCWDWYGDYVSGAQTNPTGASSGSYRMVRGGTWNSQASGYYSVRSACRYELYQSNRSNTCGFRLVRP